MIAPQPLPDELTVLAVPAFVDNYLWLLHDHAGNALAIDPGDAAAVQARIDDAQLTLRAILITHHHHDHIDGAAELAHRHGCPVYGPRDARIGMVSDVLVDGDRLTLSAPAVEFAVLHLPGHTPTHLAFVGHDSAFVGDTLFSAGCGRLNDCSAVTLMASLDRLARLDPQTRVFCAHEYTRDNARFALEWEPSNTNLQQRYRFADAQHRSGRGTLPSTIGAELAFNPFLRCDEPEIRERLQRHAAMPLNGRAEVFTELRRLKNGYVARH